MAGFRYVPLPTSIRGRLKSFQPVSLLPSWISASCHHHDQRIIFKPHAPQTASESYLCNLLCYHEVVNTVHDAISTQESFTVCQQRPTFWPGKWRVVLLAGSQSAIFCMMLCKVLSKAENTPAGVQREPMHLLQVQALGFMS